MGRPTLPENQRLHNPFVVSLDDEQAHLLRFNAKLNREPVSSFIRRAITTEINRTSGAGIIAAAWGCLLYTSDAADE